MFCAYGTNTYIPSLAVARSGRHRTCYFSACQALMFSHNPGEAVTGVASVRLAYTGQEHSPGRIFEKGNFPEWPVGQDGLPGQEDISRSCTVAQPGYAVTAVDVFTASNIEVSTLHLGSL